MWYKKHLFDGIIFLAIPWRISNETIYNKYKCFCMKRIQTIYALEEIHKTMIYNHIHIFIHRKIK